MRRLLSTLLLIVSLCVNLSAQYIGIVPHQIGPEGKKPLNVSKGVMLVDPKGVFADACDFLKVKAKGPVLSIDYGTGSAAQAGVKAASGAYRLTITPKGINIIGYDEKGAFWGLQTLRQMVEESADMRIPTCTVTDWPDSDSRGLIDCSYDDRWSQEFRLSLIDLAGHLKMTDYVYAPKDDSFACGEDWYMPYSQTATDSLKVIMDACRRNRVDFTWCLRPNEEFSWSESDYGLLLGKFEMMYFMGVRSFGILFDDVKVTEDFQDKKQELMDRINSEFAARKTDLKHILTSLDGYYHPGERMESLKLGLYGVADRGWNTESYKPMGSLMWAVSKTAGAMYTAYVTYAMNSEFADVFAMEESGDVRLIDLNGYDRQSFDNLKLKFMSMEIVPSNMSMVEDSLLYQDLKPWIEEFGKLGARCRRILECMEYFNKADLPGFWSTYAANLMSDDDRKSFEAHPSGTAVLQPYYERMMKELADAFDASYKDQVEYTLIPGEGIQTYIAPDEATVCHLILDNPQKREVIVRLSDAKDSYTAEFCIVDSYLEFEMKGDAVKVEVIGDVPVFETVFVK